MTKLDKIQPERNAWGFLQHRFLMVEASRGYTITLENGHENYAELEPNYRAHYAEMKARLESDGVHISDYNPRLSAYFQAFDSGNLLNYVVRHQGKAVGHCNVYVTNDMHNGDFIAREDVLYIVKEHRNGLGKRLVKCILRDLRERGVRRVLISPVTDLRVAKIWRRMGFQDVAMQMVYQF